MREPRLERTTEMTVKQQDEMTRALDRAYAAGLDITGQGRMRNTNRFFTIPSASEPGRTHIVVSDGTRLHCDCTAGQHEQICQHRALAHEYLVHEAAKRGAQAEAGALALKESEAEETLHTASRTLEAAIDTHARGKGVGPKLNTDTRAFSVFR